MTETKEKKKAEPKERKTPERNPVRALYLEKGRIAFALTEIFVKRELAEQKHHDKLTELSKEEHRLAERLTEIEKQLTPNTNGQVSHVTQ
jgi:hypothetical protein